MIGSHQGSEDALDHQGAELPVLRAGLEGVSCPFCAADARHPWGEENGFSAVKCGQCGIVYVSPRPSQVEITEATKLGKHRTEKGELNVSFRRSADKVAHYRRIVSDMYADPIADGRPLSWLDVGAGYGEVVEALQQALPSGSRVSGIEPMASKVNAAQRLGLPVQSKLLSELDEKYDVVSLINVFSHIPDFSDFLKQIVSILNEKGEVLIETGNGGDLAKRADFPGELYLPDHLVFAGERHIEEYLSRAGFAMICTRRLHGATVTSALKSIVKRALGKPAQIVLPYGSPFRTVFFRARLV